MSTSASPPPPLPPSSSSVDPTGASLKRFLSEGQPEQPVVMLNLLRFQRSSEGGTEESRAQYAAYMRAVAPLVRQAGAEVLYFGACSSAALVAPASSPAWDAVLLVRYPSRACFARMIAQPAYRQHTDLRTQALEAALLQPTSERQGEKKKSGQEERRAKL